MIILLIIAIIFIPICIRASHNSRLSDGSVTRDSRVIAEKVYSKIREFSLIYSINLHTDVKSIRVTTEFVEIIYRRNVQVIKFIDLNYVMDLVNGCDLKLLRLNQALVEFLGPERWAVEIIDDNDIFIPSEDLDVKVYHNDWYSSASFYYGSRKYHTIKVRIIPRSEYDRLIATRNQYDSAYRF